MTRTHHFDSLDMSVVTDPEVATALPQLLTEWRARKRWDDLAPAVLVFHAHILDSFLKHGHPPSLKGVDEATLEKLQEHDLIVLNDGAIEHTYPFAATPMPHTVTINSVTNFNVCALDAFGASAMVGALGHVRLDCAACGDSISVSIGKDGLVLNAAMPEDARIWAGIVASGECAASSQCQSMLGFCSQTHLDQWRAAQSDQNKGFCFDSTQALQAGAALFRPFMRRARSVG